MKKIFFVGLIISLFFLTGCGKYTEKTIVKDLNKINIGNKIMLYKEKDNYILKTDKEKYVLFVNYEKINFDYDIINFRKGDINEINIFNGKVIEKN